MDLYLNGQGLCCEQQITVLHQDSNCCNSRCVCFDENCSGRYLKIWQWNKIPSPNLKKSFQEYFFLIVWTFSDLECMSEYLSNCGWNSLVFVCFFATSSTFHHLFFIITFCTLFSLIVWSGLGSKTTWLGSWKDHTQHNVRRWRWQLAFLWSQKC